MEMHLHSDAKFFQGYSRKTSLYNSSIRYQPKRLPGWSFDVYLLDIFGSAGSDFELWAQPIFSPQTSFNEESISGSGPIFELRASYRWERKPAASCEKRIYNSEKSFHVSSLKILSSSLSVREFFSDLSKIEVRNTFSSMIFTKVITLAPPDLPLPFDLIAILIL